ncbi:ABC transporter permease [Vallitalea longa]|uniref:ABC transporter permease n=1 Tax=Vallitalea longa TaxID=2936439 RepID=A0A9W5YD71_9FIRM|nr:ABC transporter permease [Vallitalea longa]GKX30410.1 ABC transporter permease [Vallitalea longa]
MRKNLKFEVVRTSLAILIALVIALIIIFSTSSEPGTALKEFIIGPLDSVRHFGNVIELAIPLMFTGLAVSIMFRAQQFNLGAEGGFFIGGIGAMIISIKATLPIVAHPFAAIIFGGLLGAIIVSIPAFLKVKWNATELVSSLMLNYIALFLGLYLLNYYFRDPNSGAIASYKIPKTAKLMVIFPGTRIHAGLIIVAVMVILCYYFLYKTKWGYEIRVTGENKRFAEYSGINTAKVIILSQVLGGFLAGMGGSIEVLGLYRRFTWQELPGYGWDGIIVAILARNNPLYVPIGAVFLAYLRIGADLMARGSDVQNEVVSIIQGVIIVFIVAESFLSKYKHKLVYKEAKKLSVKGAK